ncbi:HoxN/HupN/NixA family nickel/cobalt transporter [Alicyclobacillus kakegawensis]|uniref:HoxN/HupN/NixA family nickel/cobalt transporter n=1 Tax=Alicyclobacillus kakegawensis TaxID=392012 RepID=UPI00082A9240|nr:HoxN/HupN/NixA family nickel/cobalt transporter [Alicyclobacillus kakegawensis]
MNPRRWLRYAVLIGGLHALGVTLLVVAAHRHPGLIGMAFLAYTFGLRHAFDVDHIAAIDNTVRKLVQQRADPIGVGFFFSLGHSTVVACMTVFTVLSVHVVERRLPQLQTVGGMVGTVVSGVFLLIIGVVNLFILFDVYRLFSQMRTCGHLEQHVEELLLSRGLVARLARPLLRLVTKSSHIYPIGLLFGLGFDTASEVALLAMSAMAVKNAVPLPGVLALPVLFAASMSLMDTADGVFMTTAYKWALSTPLRKVYYNLSVTGLGVAAALLIGVIELAQALVSQLGLHSALWDWVQQLDLGRLGFLLVALFILVWAMSFGFWKLFRVEERWSKATP